jgi:GntR family transcriptional regulator
MESAWDPDLPIYLQLRRRVVALILDGKIKEGESLPSVRTIGAEYRLNPLTVLKAYQQLVEEGLLESRRGLGMFVNAGARSKLLTEERKRFLDEEWPKALATMARLGITLEEMSAQNRGNLRQKKR